MSRIKHVELSGAIGKHEVDVRRARSKLEAMQSMIPVFEQAAAPA